jgi:hypothetical protein
MIGFIYKITPHDCSDYYIGSTDNMERRKNKHITDIETRNSIVYKTIRDCGGEFDMVILYEYVCENKCELKQEEQRALDKFKPKLNMVRAYCSNEDRNIYNKTRRTEKIVCDCGMEMTKVKLTQHKSRNIHKRNMEELNLYGRLLTVKERLRSEANILKEKAYNNKHYKANREKLLKKQKQYNNDNREKIKERIVCVCGIEMRKDTFNRHKKSKYHINYVNSCKEISS